MADIQPPPTWAIPIEVDPENKTANFAPVWLKWFIDLSQIINAAGGTSLAHNDLSSIQGGTLSQYYHLTQGEHTAISGTKTANTVLAGPTTGAAAQPAFRALVVADLPLTIAAGVYTPILTNVANLDASTAYECQYLRVGNSITVSGKVDVDPTAPVSTQLGISLPVASNLGAAEDCAGASASSTIAGQSAAILGDAANNRAQMEWIAIDVTNQPMYFTFTYQVI